MSFKDFEGLRKKVQKKVLTRMMRRYGLIYSVNTKSSFNDLKREYEEYPIVRETLEKCMEELGVI